MGIELWNTHLSQLVADESGKDNEKEEMQREEKLEEQQGLRNQGNKDAEDSPARCWREDEDEDEDHNVAIWFSEVDVPADVRWSPAGRRERLNSNCRRLGGAETKTVGRALVTQCGPQISSISTFQELVRNAESQVPP